jgi:uncharacterized protein YlzI (FlbEa/FlbD family)
MIKLTAPNGEVVELNPSFVVEVYDNDGEYDKAAKTVIKLAGGNVQAVVEDKATVEAAISDSR